MKEKRKLLKKKRGRIVKHLELSTGFWIINSLSQRLFQAATCTILKSVKILMAKHILAHPCYYFKNKEVLIDDKESSILL